MVKMKVGAITIGQSPRTDVVQELFPLMGEQVELIQAGALDGLTREDIQAFAPGPEDYTLISRLRDGSSVMIAERHIHAPAAAVYRTVKSRRKLILFFGARGVFSGWCFI